MVQVLRARSVSTLALFSALVLFAPACSDDDAPRPATGPRGRLTQHGDCKSHEGKTTSGTDCLQYVYDGKGVLRVTHVNAAFNCCPNKISAEITVEDRVIRIVEEEDLEHPCDCDCLYDVEYEFLDIEPGTYDIHVVEPYLPEGDEPLSFAIDLQAAPSDTLCVARHGYPWPGDGEPHGSFVGATGCKGGAGASRRDSLDCVAWRWDGISTLNITHVNAAFNCCPDSLGGGVSVSDGVIRITETGEGDCRCECLYDLEYRIDGLAPGTYRVEVEEPDLPPCDLPLAATLPLGAAESGRFCAERSGYPWAQ
jgi:hypothetical protein